jgi:hypothetical protein
MECYLLCPCDDLCRYTHAIIVSISNVFLLRFKNVATLANLILEQLMAFEISRVTPVRFSVIVGYNNFKLVRKCNLDSACAKFCTPKKH